MHKSLYTLTTQLVILLENLGLHSLQEVQQRQIRRYADRYGKVRMLISSN